MATIVMPQREDYAERYFWNFIGDLAGNLIKQQQERDANRKYNTAIADALKSQPESYGMIPPSMNEPEGYNDNGWAKTFHQTTNPVAEFDANLGNTQASAPSMMTQADYMRRLAENLGNPRWSHLSTEEAMKRASPYLTAIEQARQEQLRREAGQSLMNENDRLNQAWNWTAQGVLPSEMLSKAQSEYQYRNPYRQPYTQNSGSVTNYGDFNPFTGEYTQQGSFENTLTPQQEAEIAYKDRVFNEDVYRDRANREQNAYEFDENLRYKRENRDIDNERWEKEYGLKQDEADIRRRESEAKIDAIKNSLTDTEKTRIETNENQIKYLYDQRKELIKHRGIALKNGGTVTIEGTGENLSLEQIDRAIKEIDGRIDKLTQENNSIINSKLYSQQTQSSGQPQQNTQATKTPAARLGSSMDMGANILGGGDKVSVKTPFGGNSKGAVYTAPKGTPVLVPDTGSRMRVTRVGSDTVNGYGNYVELTGKVNGHEVKILMAHLGNDSIGVRQGDEVFAGDVIGASGDDMYLETSIDGEYRDPAAITESIMSNIGQERNNVPNSKRALYVHPNGKVITVEQWEGMKRKAQAGEMPGVYTEQDLEEKILADGYTLREGAAPINNSGDIATLPPSSSDIPPVSGDTAALPPSSSDISPVSGDTTAITAPTGNDITSRVRGFFQPLAAEAGEPTLFPENEQTPPAGSLVYPVPTERERAFDDMSSRLGPKAHNAFANPPRASTPSSSVNNTGEYSKADRFNDAYVGQIDKMKNALKSHAWPASSDTSALPPSYDISPDEEVDYTANNGDIEAEDEGVMFGLRQGRRRGRGRGRVRGQVRRGTAKPVPVNTAKANARTRANAAKYRDIIDTNAQKYGVEPELIEAIIETESNWNPNARSHVGARGLMQLMPDTAKWLGVKNSLDPSENIRGGTSYIGKFLKQYGGNIEKALWAYNAGPGNVKRGRKPTETQNYIPKVMGIYNRLKAEKRASVAPARTPVQQASTSADIQAPQTWTDNNGQALISNDTYEDLVRRAESGDLAGYRTRGDIDAKIKSMGGTKAPSVTERHEIARLNGDNVNGMPSSSYDYEVLPYSRTPKTSPEKYPAPEFTDRINHTTERDMQNEIGHLNGKRKSIDNYADILEDISRQMLEENRQYPSEYWQDLPIIPEDEDDYYDYDEGWETPPLYYPPSSRTAPIPGLVPLPGALNEPLILRNLPNPINEPFEWQLLRNSRNRRMR